MTVQKSGHMSKKSIQSNTKSVPHGTILIPELEEAMARQIVPREWSQREKATLSKYYNRVNVRILMKYLPGRTLGAIRSQAQSMVIQQSRGKQ